VIKVLKFLFPFDFKEIRVELIFLERIKTKFLLKVFFPELLYYLIFQNTGKN